MKNIFKKTNVGLVFESAICRFGTFCEGASQKIWNSGPKFFRYMVHFCNSFQHKMFLLTSFDKIGIVKQHFSTPSVIRCSIFRQNFFAGRPN